MFRWMEGDGLVCCGLLEEQSRSSARAFSFTWQRHRALCVWPTTSESSFTLVSRSQRLHLVSVRFTICTVSVIPPRRYWYILFVDKHTQKLSVVLLVWWISRWNRWRSCAKQTSLAVLCALPTTSRCDKTVQYTTTGLWTNTCLTLKCTCRECKQTMTWRSQMSTGAQMIPFREARLIGVENPWEQTTILLTIAYSYPQTPHCIIPRNKETIVQPLMSLPEHWLTNPFTLLRYNICARTPTSVCL